jgi:lyso-ornithine lipid O-acyltransferase
MIPLRQAARDLARTSFRTTGFVALTLGAGVGVSRAVRNAPPSPDEITEARDRWSGGWARSLLRLFGVTVVTHHHGPVSAERPRNRGRIVVANHRSIIDIALLLSEFGGCLVARGDIAGWPLLGPAIAAGGTIFVDRADKKSGSGAIAQMVHHLDQGASISLFPEGTTFEDDLVRPFKVGGFVAAQRSSAVVVPVGLVYPEDSGAAYRGETFLTHLARLAKTKGTLAHVEIGAPLEAHPDEDPPAFAERTRQEVQRLVDLARQKSRQANHQPT